MRMTRLYQSVPLKENEIIELDEKSSHHLINVLREKIQAPLILFNGKGGEYKTTLVKIDKKKASVHIDEFFPIDRESPFDIHLAQALCKSDKMDYIIQKAVELGVKSIAPIFSERCDIKLDEKRLQKRTEHWHNIIISACEQCKRNFLPLLYPAENFKDWIKNKNHDERFILEPTSPVSFKELKNPIKQASFLIGPEGGFSDHEISLAKENGIQSISLGPRILRTETAGLAVISMAQCRFGDF